MAYVPVKPEELKELVLMGRKRTMHFAYNPGVTEDDLLLIDRKKKPEALGRLVRQEGEGNKIACGVFEVDGRVVRLTTEATLPQLAKKFRRLLKQMSLSFRVEVINPDGLLIEADEEDSFEEDGQRPKEAPDLLADLKSRLQKVQVSAAAQGGLTATLREAAKEIVECIKAGDLQGADADLRRLEDELAGDGPQEEVHADYRTACRAARDNWSNLRSTIRADLLKLQTALEAQTYGFAGLGAIASRLKALLALIDDLDETLEKTLSHLLQSAPGSVHALEAAQTIRAYRDVLSSPHFSAVDTDGLTHTDIQTAALQALDQVETALAA